MATSWFWTNAFMRKTPVSSLFRLIDCKNRQKQPITQSLSVHLYHVRVLKLHVIFLINSPAFTLPRQCNALLYPKDPNSDGSLSFLNVACLHEYLTDCCQLWGRTNWMHFKFLAVLWYHAVCVWFLFVFQRYFMSPV